MLRLLFGVLCLRVSVCVRVCIWICADAVVCSGVILTKPFSRWALFIFLLSEPWLLCRLCKCPRFVRVWERGIYSCFCLNVRAYQMCVPMDLCPCPPPPPPPRNPLPPSWLHIHCLRCHIIVHTGSSHIVLPIHAFEEPEKALGLKLHLISVVFPHTSIITVSFKGPVHCKSTNSVFFPECSLSIKAIVLAGMHQYNKLLL